MCWYQTLKEFAPLVCVAFPTFLRESEGGESNRCGCEKNGNINSQNKPEHWEASTTLNQTKTEKEKGDIREARHGRSSKFQTCDWIVTLGKTRKNIEATGVRIHDFGDKDTNLSKICLYNPSGKTVTTSLLKGELVSAGQHCSRFNKTLFIFFF